MVIRREADGQNTELIRKSSQKAAELPGEKKSPEIILISRHFAEPQ